MDVLQVVKYYFPHYGGIENYTRQIVQGLKDKVNMRVLTANRTAKTVDDKIDGVEIKRVSSFGERFSVPLAPTFPFWLRKMKADIIHFQAPFPLAEFSQLLVGNTAKIVVSWHSDIVKQIIARKIFEPFLLRFLNRADKILVATPNHITSSIYLPRYKDKCEVVPYGIETDKFTNINSEDPRVKEIKEKYRKPIILFVGRLVYYKGIEYLVRAMKDIDGKLLIIGNGPLKDKINLLIDEHKLNEKVKILDSVGNQSLPFYYHACDIFVLPSIANSEAFGIVQLEAMACGKPVISTELPTGVTYVNRNGLTGLTVPIMDSSALATALKELLNNPQLRNEYGNNGRERVQSLFNRDQLIEKIYKVYSGLMG
jgi:glycosyltransferase involved in cell wall biosynthesis